MRVICRYKIKQCLQTSETSHLTMGKVSYRPHRCTFIVYSCLSIPIIVKITSQERGKSSSIYNVWVKVGSLHRRYAVPYTESHRWDAEIVMQGFVVCVMQEVSVGCLSSSVLPQIEWIFSIWPGILGMVIGDGRGKLSKAVVNKRLKKKKDNFFPVWICLFQQHWNLWSLEGNWYSLEGLCEEKGKQGE